jgi:hypothetical protein
VDILPSERVLRDYKNYFKPKAGLNLDNIECLGDKSNLAFDKYSGELIGFVDLGDPVTNYATLGNEDVMATHALAFLVREMCTDMKDVIAYYFTENVTSYQLMSVFWKIVGCLNYHLTFGS